MFSFGVDDGFGGFDPRRIDPNDPEALFKSAWHWAQCGAAVFPVGRDKRPRTLHGLLDATRDPTRIADWSLRWPATNWAIRTGEASGLVVLDVDPRDAGDDSLSELEHEHGTLPLTTSVVTPRGGQHYFFSWPGFEVRTTAGVIGPGLDIRGDGGYVLVPPSFTRAGTYQWDEADAAPAAMPEWLVVDTRAERGTERPAAPPDVWITMLRRGLVRGQRNDGLARLTGYLLRRYTAVDVVAELIYVVNQTRCCPPLAVREVDRIIDSVAARELRRRERAAL
jgi:hypothetical protein